MRMQALYPNLSINDVIIRVDGIDVSVINATNKAPQTGSPPNSTAKKGAEGITSAKLHAIKAVKTIVNPTVMEDAKLYLEQAASHSWSGKSAYDIPYCNDICSISGSKNHKRVAKEVVGG